MSNYLTVPEVATELRMSPSKVANLLRSGALEGAKPNGHQWLVKPEWVERYVASTSNQAPSRRRRRRSA